MKTPLLIILAVVVLGAGSAPSVHEESLQRSAITLVRSNL
jgi:hypothetical protein